jgi:uncharacterized protein DUF3223
MESYNPGHTFTGEDRNIILDVIKRHPNANEKIGPGIKEIILGLGKLGDRHILIERVDGSWASSGHKGAVFPKTPLAKFHSICRQVTSDITNGPPLVDLLEMLVLRVM